MNSIQSILAQDQASRDKERITNLCLAPLQLVILTMLFYFVAHGKDPLIRTGYTLMAVGLAITLAAAWLFESWSRQALPGPADTRSQLQKAAFLLSRQVSLTKTGHLWTAPVFLGGALIGFWAYQQRRLDGYVIWSLLILVWAGAYVFGRKKAIAATQKKERMEDLLRDLE